MVPARRLFLVLTLVLTSLGVTAPASATSCSVPSMAHATIQSAVDDLSCDPIQVAAGTFAEAVSIGRNVTITGAGAGQTIIDPAAGRPITVTSGTVAISDLSAQGGNVVAGHRGGISVGDTLTLDRVVVKDNVAGFSGGGIFVETSSTLTIRDSTISGNAALDGNGGAVNIQFSTTVRIERSTISGNSAVKTGDADGGGIYGGTSGTLVVVNSTISGNRAEGDGGGALTYGTATFANTTVTENRADDDGNGLGDGGGVSWSGSGSLTLIGTVVAGNVDATMSGTVAPDCSGTVLSGGHNLIGSTQSCGFTPGTGDLPNTSAQLTALADHGGPTLTHALKDGSPAIDAGDPGGCNDGTSVLVTDQRGEPRAVDGEGDGTVRCDIGAYEWAPKQVSLKAKPRKVPEGKKTRLTTTVAPCTGHEGDPVQFLRGSKVITEKATDEECSATRRVKVRKTSRFRAVSPADDDHPEASSKRVKVRVSGD